MAAANWVQRDTRFSSNDYFLKLSQLQAGEESKAPKLDKRIYGGSFGGPVAKDKLFFFGNYERLNEDSESPVLRNIPSLSMRDGVLIYPCADRGAVPRRNASRVHRLARGAAPGNYGHDAGRTGIGRPARHRSEPAGDGLLQDSIPCRTIPGIDGLNLVGYRFAAPVKNAFNTYIGRVDYRHSTATSRCSAGSTCRTIRVVERAAVRRAQAPNTTRKVKSRGFALGWDAVLSAIDGQHVPLRPHADQGGHRRAAETSQVRLPQHRPTSTR